MTASLVVAAWLGVVKTAGEMLLAAWERIRGRRKPEAAPDQPAAATPAAPAGNVDELIRVGGKWYRKRPQRAGEGKA